MRRLKSAAGPHEGHDSATPERRMWIAVLEHVFNDSCYAEKQRKGVSLTEKNIRARKMRVRLSKRDARECARYISECGASFRFVCSNAGMDADFLSEKFRAGKFDHAKFKSAVKNG